MFTKMCIFSFTMPMTIKLGRVMSQGEKTHLLFQITCRSSDHVLFEKRHVSTNARPQDSAAYIKHRKTHKSKACFIIQKYLNFIHTDIHTLKISKLCRKVVYPIALTVFVLVQYRGYQWISKLLTQIALCEHASDNSSAKQGNLAQFFTRDFLIYKKHTRRPHKFLLIPQHITMTSLHTKK